MTQDVIKDLMLDGIRQEVKRQAGTYLQAYLFGWAEDLREARLKQKLIELKAARAKALEIIAGMED